MYAAQLGGLKFTQWDGDPAPPQTVWLMEERSGNEGVFYIDAGLSADVFEAMVWTDVATYAQGHDLARIWASAVSLPPQTLSIGTKTFPNKFKLLRMAQPQVQAIVVAYGGQVDGATARVLTRLQLREVFTVEATEEL